MITNDEKDKILLMNKYTKITGYGMPYLIPNSDFILISRTQVEECYNKKPEVYYFEEDSDEAYNLESSWENFLDTFSDNLTDEQIETLIKIKFLDKNKRC